MLVAALFITKKWEQPNCPSTDECINKVSLYTQWNIIQLYKRNEVVTHATI